MFSTSKRLGIIGGGQLGKMLINEAMRWDVPVWVLDPAGDAPCSHYAHHFVQGSLEDEEVVYAFGMNCDVITVEIEHVNTKALFRLIEKGKKVYPHPSILETIQDKIQQKELYVKHGIPTSPFQSFSGIAECIASKPTFPVVWKSAKGGYDGKGVQILRAENELKQLPDVPCLLETFVPEMQEIAIIVARNSKGEEACFAPVEMVFHPQANLVEWIACPAQINEDQIQRAQKIAEKVARVLDLVGILAVEMFVLPTGEIWVNESAPRPHNSGHLTIESSFTSQYQQHLRAVLGLSLGSTQQKCPAVMLNLLGEPGFTGFPIYEGVDAALEIEGVYIHLYGKLETRPFRKMGHITILGTTLEEAAQKANRVRQLLKVKA